MGVGTLCREKHRDRGSVIEPPPPAVVMSQGEQSGAGFRMMVRSRELGGDRAPHPRSHRVRRSVAFRASPLSPFPHSGVSGFRFRASGSGVACCRFAGRATKNEVEGAEFASE